MTFLEFMKELALRIVWASEEWRRRAIFLPPPKSLTMMYSLAGAKRDCAEAGEAPITEEGAITGFAQIITQIKTEAKGQAFARTARGKMLFAAMVAIIDTLNATPAITDYQVLYDQAIQPRRITAEQERIVLALLRNDEKLPKFLRALAANHIRLARDYLRPEDQESSSSEMMIKQVSYESSKLTFFGEASLSAMETIASFSELLCQIRTAQFYRVDLTSCQFTTEQFYNVLAAIYANCQRFPHKTVELCLPANIPNDSVLLLARMIKEGNNLITLDLGACPLTPENLNIILDALIYRTRNNLFPLTLYLPEGANKIIDFQSQEPAKYTDGIFVTFWNCYRGSKDGWLMPLATKHLSLTECNALFTNYPEGMSLRGKHMVFAMEGERARWAEQDDVALVAQSAAGPAP